MANPNWQEISRMAVPVYDPYNPAAQNDGNGGVVDPRLAFENATNYNKIADDLNAAWGEAAPLDAGASGFAQSPYKTYYEYTNADGEKRYLVPQRNLGLNAQGHPEVSAYMGATDGDTRYVAVGNNGVARSPQDGLDIPGLEKTPGFTGFMEYAEKPREVSWTKPKEEGVLQSMAGGATVLGAFLGAGGFNMFGGAAGLAEEAAALGVSDLSAAGIGSGASGSFLDGVQSFFKQYVSDPVSEVFNKAFNFFDSATTGASNAAEIVGDVGAGGGGGGLGGDLLAQQVSGLPSTASETLLSGETGAFDMGTGGVAEAMGLTPSAANVSPGVINSAVDWMKKNPSLAVGGGQLIFGALNGIGNRQAAAEMMDRRIQADKELLAQRASDAKELEEWKRRFTQAGSFFDATVPVRAPATSQPLRRPDGSQVYSNGIIANSVGG